MLRPYLKIWDWDLIFGRAVKAISSPDVRSPCSSGSNAVKPDPGGDLATTRPSLMLPNGESVLRARKLDFSDDVQRASMFDKLKY